MSELQQLSALLRQLGASSGQAETMAAQMLKRADQLAIERGIERTAALKYLIELVTKGRSGEAPSAFPPSVSS
jgi:hypothetical protein